VAIERNLVVVAGEVHGGPRISWQQAYPVWFAGSGGVGALCGGGPASVVEGLRVQSFRTLLANLASLVKNRVLPRGAGRSGRLYRVDAAHSTATACLRPARGPPNRDVDRRQC
jgi:hypothetical protein